MSQPVRAYNLVRMYPVHGKFIGNLLKNKIMDVKLILVGLTVVFTVLCLFYGTKNGFYDSDDYHGNGSAH
jgi:hypothetical protein